MLLRRRLDCWVMKRLSWRRLLLCLWVGRPSITGTRAGAMDDRVQLRVRPVLAVLLRPLLESGMFGRISTTQGVTAIRIRTLDHSQGSVTQLYHQDVAFSRSSDTPPKSPIQSRLGTKISIGERSCHSPCNRCQGLRAVHTAMDTPLYRWVEILGARAVVAR